MSDHPEIKLENYPEIYEDVKNTCADDRIRSALLLNDARSNMEARHNSYKHNKIIRRLYAVQITVELIILASFCYLMIDKLG